MHQKCPMPVILPIKRNKSKIQVLKYTGNFRNLVRLNGFYFLNLPEARLRDDQFVLKLKRVRA